MQATLKNKISNSILSTKRYLISPFNILLISLILLFAVRPYERGHIYMLVWHLFFVIVFLSSIFDCNHPRKVKIMTFCLGIPALVTQWISLVYPGRQTVLIFLIFTSIFLLTSALSILLRVIVNVRVTLQALRGVICVYFMFAFVFSFCYVIIELMHPKTFNITLDSTIPFAYNHFLSEMMYFSFSTMLCIGFGDIVAVGDIGQTFAIIQGVIGQFYVAMLVARLVAIYSFYEHKLHLIHKKSP